ncbi:hypothetical protein TNCV_4231791 [Trichonephila clavipes]|nr:hypothetical protein TNCV_4231791 [Trichonephila clavipes]
MDANSRMVKQFGITGDKQEHFEYPCYETIDILQAPRLVNDPFAYAYTTIFSGMILLPGIRIKLFHKVFQTGTSYGMGPGPRSQWGPRLVLSLKRS